MLHLSQALQRPRIARHSNNQAYRLLAGRQMQWIFETTQMPASDFLGADAIIMHHAHMVLRLRISFIGQYHHRIEGVRFTCIGRH